MARLSFRINNLVLTRPFKIIGNGRYLSATAATIERAASELTRVREEIGRVIVGQNDVIEGVLICLIGGGHVLLEGVPGLGKTTLLRTLSSVLDLQYSRIQFTPDLMPADIVGSVIMDDEHGHKTFRFQPGPIFANLVLADEINRATPKTQSALLEAMQERTVTSGTSPTHSNRLFSSWPPRTRSKWRVPIRFPRRSSTAS